ncbi:MAG: hypothetical protein ACI9CV_001073 [Ilumatobacter sp.]
MRFRSHRLAHELLNDLVVLPPRPGRKAVVDTYRCGLRHDDGDGPEANNGGDENVRGIDDGGAQHQEWGVTSLPLIDPSRGLLRSMTGTRKFDDYVKPTSVDRLGRRSREERSLEALV